MALKVKNENQKEKTMKAIQNKASGKYITRIAWEIWERGQEVNDQRIMWTDQPEEAAMIDADDVPTGLNAEFRVVDYENL